MAQPGGFLYINQPMGSKVVTRDCAHSGESFSAMRFASSVAINQAGTDAAENRRRDIASY
jgi:hypothetical protein